MQQTQTVRKTPKVIKSHLSIEVINTSAMEQKACVTCSENKPINAFVHRDGKCLGQCKVCRNLYVRRYKQERADGIRSKQETVVTNNGKVCRICNEWKTLSEFPRRNTEHGYRHECKVCKQESLDAYYQTTYNKVRRDRKQTDIQYRLLSNHRLYVYKCLTKFSLKNQSSVKYIGCSVEVLKKWLEYMFTTDMSWENYGKLWTIDHVIPLSKFDMTNPKDCEIAFSWFNMHPSTDNFEKSNKFRMWEYMNVLVSATRFIRKNAYKCEWYQGLRESLNWLRKNSDMVKIH